MPTAKVRLGGSIQQKKGLVFGGNQDDVEDDSRQSGLVLYVCEVAEVLEVGAVGNGGPTCKRTTSATTAINDLAKRAHGRLGDSGIRLRGGESREQPSYSHRWAKLPTTAAEQPRGSLLFRVASYTYRPRTCKGEKRGNAVQSPPPYNAYSCILALHSQLVSRRRPARCPSERWLPVGFGLRRAHRPAAVAPRLSTRTARAVSTHTCGHLPRRPCRHHLHCRLSRPCLRFRCSSRLDPLQHQGAVLVLRRSSSAAASSTTATVACAAAVALFGRVLRRRRPAHLAHPGRGEVRREQQCLARRKLLEQPPPLRRRNSGGRG